MYTHTYLPKVAILLSFVVTVSALVALSARADAMVGALALAALAASALTVAGPASAESDERWQVVMGSTVSRDEAVKVALDDLQEAGTAHGLAFEIADDAQAPSRNAILVGDASRNGAVARLIAGGVLTVAGMDDEQGYEIVSRDVDGRRIVVVAGGSAAGDVYGLYWVWDRLRVFRKIPEINTRRVPAMPIRLAAAWGRGGSGGRSREEMRRCLRYSINWVAGPPVLDLVPWDSEPERTRNEHERENTRDLIAYAHALHMKLYSFATDFTYHPSLIEEFGATLNASDPKFWDAVQAKYRRLLEALPELDGIELCNDDISGFWDNYAAFDLMHEGEGCDWPFEKRYRTFVKKMHEVVVEEFHKTYFHFTWSVASHEQHSQPEVFEKIFTDEIPVEGLYLMPKITAGDRWWHQPYNKTFNLTPHKTLVTFETMNYYESHSAHLFPTFPGQYFQAGLQTFLRPDDTNVAGAALWAGVRQEVWGTTQVHDYVLYRLMWDPYEDLEQIVKDFCAIHFGPKAADGMAAIYLASPVAYKYGLHIEPVSYGEWNSLVHMRVGTFPAMGYPRIDGGKEHMGFLQDIYLRCKPWRAETLAYLDHGLATIEDMDRRFEKVRPLLEDPGQADRIAEHLDMTRFLITVNNRFVRTTFAYFAYLDAPTPEHKAALAEAYGQFEEALDTFTHAPGFDYQLFGIEVLMPKVREALEDVAAAKQALKDAPTRPVIERTIAEQQALVPQGSRGAPRRSCAVRPRRNRGRRPRYPHNPRRHVPDGTPTLGPRPHRRDGDRRAVAEGTRHRHPERPHVPADSPLCASPTRRVQRFCRRDLSLR